VTTPLPLDPVPPFVFPDSRILAGSHAYPTYVPFEKLMQTAAGVVGVVSGLDRHGANWLIQFLADSHATCRLIAVLYPACPTDANVLNRLLHVQAAADDRDERGPAVEIRMLPLTTWPPSAPNTLCFLPALAGEEPYLLTGSSPNFGAHSSASADINVIFRPGLELLDAWCNWFEWVWQASVPLTRQTASIPPLVPAPGSADAAQAWRDYLTLCRNARAGAEAVPESVVSVDPETGQVAVTDWTCPGFVDTWVKPPMLPGGTAARTSWD
jgi:hypothetical protein